MNQKGLYMGSTGSGNFTDYTGARSENNQTGGVSGKDRCEIAISCMLEDVGQSSYYSQHRHVPPTGNYVLIQLNNQRIAAIDAQSGLDCGALPTHFNYLLSCIENGYSYAGVISNSSNGLNPLIEIDVAHTPRT
ncbi:hypothetical protein [Vibrio parahaemolyticus]|uniref:hypothetical protein n=1 Tax=Vibrio parahaemolyticus TaxID=670 RepID=UPI0021524281|nr:hypothetical protein [Vibrio parahaemolyticus]